MAFHKYDAPIPYHVLERFLGRGALGEVWLVRGPGGVSKAMKFIDLEYRHGVKELLAIQQIKRIHNAHLAQITDVWLLDTEGQVIPDEVLDEVSSQLSNPNATMSPGLPLPHTLAVAMTLADKSLHDRLKECEAEGRQGIPYEELISYMQEAAKGIDFLNQPHVELGGRAIQHCDIKPQNLLLVGGSVQVCDFGLARVVGQRKTTNRLEGTLAYIAPEAARGEKPTPTTDQYSLAISYYELRTGSTPFPPKTSALEMLTAHTTGNLDFSLAGEAEQKVLRKATSLNPEERYPSNRAFVEAMIEANAQPVLRPSPWARYAALASSALLLALVALWVVFLRPGDARRAPTVELPAGFQAAEGDEPVTIGDRAYPRRIVRRFRDGAEVAFVLIHEPHEEQLFYMMENKVSNGLFRRYVEQSPDALGDSPWAPGDRDPDGPVLGVTVEQAYAFSQWLAGPKGHLPSIVQWDTAAGLYRPDRTGAGPFVEPYEPGTIAVDRESEGPMRVGEARNDVSPFGVRDMAGNGYEFTRSIHGGRGEVPLPNPTDIDAVLRRGRSFAAEGPLRYDDLVDREHDKPWPYPYPSPDTGFRVVIEKLAVPSSETRGSP